MSYTWFNQAEYGIRVLVVALQEYVNTYSTRRVRVITLMGLTRINPTPPRVGVKGALQVLMNRYG